MRERDLEEFLALAPVDDGEALAQQLARQYGERNDVLCVFDDRDEPVCIGGTIETRPNVMTLLFFATDEFPRVVRPLTRFIRNELFPRYFAIGVHRIEAVAMAKYVEVHGWLARLGLKQETGTLHAFGKGREDFVQFALVTDEC